MLTTPPPPPLRAQKTLPIIITNNVSPKTGFQFKGVNPLWSGHTRKRCNSLVAVIHKQESRHNVPKSVLRAVLGRMQFTLHATRRTPHGASRLVQAMSACLVKTRRAPSRRSRDARLFGHTTTTMHILSTSPPPPAVSFFPAPSCSNAPPSIEICQSNKHFYALDITSLSF